MSVAIFVWLSVGARLSVSDFADAYKVDGPTERCEEPAPTPVQSCGDKVIPHSKHVPLTLKSFVREGSDYTILSTASLKKGPECNIKIAFRFVSQERSIPPQFELKQPANKTESSILGRQ